MSERIFLVDIRRDGGTQPRLGLSTETVFEYAEAMRAGATFPDVIVFYDGKDYWLADGFHRVAAALEANQPAINATVRQGQRRDAVLYSVGANSDHGLRRNNADKRRAVETLLRDEEWCKWSDSEIARRANVSHPTVAKIRAEIYPEKFQDERTVERNGTTYTMNVGKRESVLSEEEQAEMNRVYSGQTIGLKDIPHLEFVIVTKSNEYGLVTGVNDDRYPGRVQIKRPNGPIGWMTHWIARDQLTYPIDWQKAPKGLHTSRLWQYRSSLKESYKYSKSGLMTQGWFNFKSVLADESRRNLEDDKLIEANRNNWNFIRITASGCEWLGFDALEYPEPVEMHDSTSAAIDAAPSPKTFRAGDEVITSSSQLVGKVIGQTQFGVLVHVHQYNQQILYKPESLELHTSAPAAAEQPVIEQPAAVDQQPEETEETEDAAEVFTEAMNFFFDGEDILETAPTLYRVLQYANGTINADKQLKLDAQALINWLYDYLVHIEDELEAATPA